MALGVLLLLSAGAAAAQSSSNPDAAQPVVVSEQARARFETGVQLLQDPDGARYEEAYEEFKAAYADSPSWKILGNLALCAMKLERDGEAIAALERSLAEGGAELDPEEKKQQESDLKLLKDRAATVTVRSEPGATLLDERITVSGGNVKNQYRVPDSGELVLLVRPGNHRLTAQLSSGSETGEASLQSGASATLDLSPKPLVAPAATSDTPAAPRETAGPSKLPAYLSLGVGAAGVIAGGVFLGLHLDSSGQASQLFDDCASSGDCGRSEVDRIDQLDGDAATFGTVSIISFGVGAVGIGTGIALLLMQPKEEGPVAKGFSLRPYASAHTLGIAGRF